MTETKRQIKELKAALPHIREKVIAVAVMLALSVTMIASVSYAWYTMSFAPELTGISTNVTSNGNLEIALSDFDGLEPNSSAVGDSFSAQNQTTHGANTTWGNLINLSGNYGIEDLILRPASFNSDSKYYLSSVKYTDDGRVEGTTTDFAFTSWTETGSVGDTILHDFTVISGSAFGVRAISSVGFGDGGKSLMLLKMDAARATLAKSTTAYSKLVTATETVETIRDVVNVYLDYYSYKALESKNMAGMAGMLGVTGNSDITALMPSLVSVFEEFYAAVLLYGDALKYLEDVQVEFDATKVNLGSAQKSYNTLVASVERDLTALRAEAAETSTTFEDDPEILSIINRLIDIDSSIISGGGIENKSVKALMNDVSGAVDIVLNMQSGTELTVIVTKGNLHTFEKLHGTHATMRLENLKLVGKTVHGTMYTNATGNQYEEAISITQDLDTSFMNNMVAQDTYGMVVDLWFRTNSPDGTLLTLDGLVETVTRYEDRLIKLTGESKSRNVYVYNRPTGAVLGGIALTEEVLVFRGEADDTNYEEGCYYNILTLSKVFIAEVRTVNETDEAGNVLKDENGKEITKNIVVDTETPVGDADVTKKRDAYEDVVGFHGSNRYDGDYTFTEGNEISATQGTGTCFVFYADTPEESAAALELLGHLKLAFMDADGNLLAQAAMDVEHVYAESGKYTVPIVITDTDATAVDNEGNTVHGITAMQKNVPIRISVVVYLDGENLENSMAFSNGSIQGSLNFQFSTDEDLNALKNTDLSNKIIELSATISQDYFDKYTGAVQTATLSAIIDGLDASRVEAVFQRKINATQGSRMQPITLTRQEGTNTWSGTAGFMMPGTYILNSLWIDGVEYGLPQPITVTMTGFSVSYVKFCDDPGEDVALTADGYVNRDVSVKFATDVQPQSVVARFESENGTFSSARLSLDANGYWNGTARFSSSGTYTLAYLVLTMADGQETYFELEGAFRKDFTAYLGLRASISLDDSRANISFEYMGPRTIDVKVEIFTDNDDVIRGLENVSLNYGKRGSNVAANGLFASLTWRDGAYYGQFNVNKVGVFNFTRLVAGTNEITVASQAPSISAISLDPPEYINSDATEQVILLPGDSSEKANYVAKIEEATTATIYAVFVNKATGNTIMVEADYSDAENGNYSFAIPYATGTTDTPKPTGGNRNGNWTVTELRFYEVYDENGGYYGEGEGAVAEYYTQTPNYEFAVFDEFVVTVDSLTGNNAIDTGAAFMEGQQLKYSDGTYMGLTIVANNVEFPANVSISNVALTLTHSTTDMKNYGGYEYQTVTDANGNALATVTDASLEFINNKWRVDENVLAHLAGKYTCSVTITMTVTNDDGSANTKSFTYGQGNATKVEVYSVKPSLTVYSASTNNGSWAMNGTSFTSHTGAGSGASAVTSVKNTYDAANNNLTVYIAATYWSGSKILGRAYGAGIYYDTQTQNGTISGSEDDVAKRACPYVVLQLSNAGAAFDTASFSLQGDNSLSLSHTFTRGENTSGTFTTSSMRVGNVSGTWGIDLGRWGALGARCTIRATFGRNKTISTIDMVYNGVTYTVTLEKPLTINNPS